MNLRHTRTCTSPCTLPPPSPPGYGLLIRGSIVTRWRCTAAAYKLAQMFAEDAAIFQIARKIEAAIRFCRRDIIRVLHVSSRRGLFYKFFFQISFFDNSSSSQAERFRVRRVRVRVYTVVEYEFHLSLVIPRSAFVTRTYSYSKFLFRRLSQSICSSKIVGAVGASIRSSLIRIRFSHVISKFYKNLNILS